MKYFDGLPDFCLGVLPSTGEVIIIKRGESGYYPYYDGIYSGKEKAKELNDKFDVTPAQVEAMTAGSMFGWETPGADPARYDKDGKYISRRQ